MPLARVHKQAAPDNVTSGDYTVTVTGTYDCGSVVQPFVLDNSLGMTSGKYVLLRANAISNYAGATVTPPTGLSVVGVSQEAVNYSGTTYQCVVVTLT